jgi:hypothetical protein
MFLTCILSNIVVYISSVNDCNEWKIEKSHEYTNIGKLPTTRIMI